jgi:signal transduction histidine kinase
LQGISKTGQKIILSFTKSDSYFVNLDKKLIRNIIINLVSNSIKFSPENTNITISLNLSKSEVMLSVADHGIGIPETDQKHLFERFFRSSKAKEILPTDSSFSSDPDKTLNAFDKFARRLLFKLIALARVSTLKK